MRSKSFASVVSNKFANETDVSWTRDAQDCACIHICFEKFPGIPVAKITPEMKLFYNGIRDKFSFQYHELINDKSKNTI